MSRSSRGAPARRLVHLSASRVPSRSANSIQVMRAAAAFAAEGLAVTLCHSPGDEAGLGDPFAFYGVQRCFRLLRYPDREGGDRLGRRVGRAVRAVVDGGFATRLALLERPDLVIARSLPQLARWLRSPLAARARAAALELHEPPRREDDLRLLREVVASSRLTGVLVVSARLREVALSLLPDLPPERILVVRNAYDPPAAPLEPAVPLEGAFRLGYAGGLHEGAGVETVAAAIEGLEGVVLHVLGGSAEEVAALRWRLPAGAPVRLHGRVPPADVPGWLAACDALVAPYARGACGGGGVAKADWMSPLKLFECMAADRPIIASDLPAVAEILADGRTALLARPGDPAAWRRAVERLRAEPGLGRALAAAAGEELRTSHTWKVRTRRVLDFLGEAPTSRG